MNMNLLESIHAGFEDLDYGVVSENSIYVSALMGSEGFMDTVKKGAQSAVKWVKSLIRSLMDWVRKFFGKFSKEKLVVAEDKKDKFLSAIKEIKGFLARITDNDTQAFNVNTGKIYTAIDKLVAGVNNGSDVSGLIDNVRGEMIDFSSKMDSLSKSLKEDEEEKARVAGKMISAVGRSMAALRKAADKLKGGFEYSKSMKSAIDSGSNSRVVAGIKAELDHTGYTPEEINEIITHLEKDKPDAFAPYEEDNLSRELSPKADWSADEYDKQASYYVGNGSLKRLHHLRDMRNYLYEKKVKGFF